MIATRQDFKESIAFELYVLERLRPVIESDSTCVIDLRDSNAVNVNVSIHENASDAAINKLKDELAPLLFGAGWKVLDLLMELVLSTTEFKPKQKDGTWKIKEKEEHAKDGHGDQAWLACSKDVWETLLLAYAATVEHRHSLVHRTSNVDVAIGTMDCIEKNGNPLRPLTRNEQISLSKAATLAARGVINGGMDYRSEERLKYQLDQLRTHTQAPPFGGGLISEPIEILLTLEHSDGIYFLDISKILATARSIRPTSAHFNVIVDIPDGSGRKLFGYAEECPPERSKIDLLALPSWLTYL